MTLWLCMRSFSFKSYSNQKVPSSLSHPSLKAAFSVKEKS